MIGLAVALLCLALGGVTALEMHHVSVAHGFPLPWSTVLATTMPRWLLLAVLLPFVLLLATRMAQQPSRPRVLLSHGAVFLGLSVVHAIVLAWSAAFASPGSYLFPWSARFFRAWFNGMPILVSLYGAVLAVAWAINASREREQRSIRASQLEAQLQSARLAVLRARLQPHFLYNTLNGIAALVADQRSAKAVAAIEQLSELLHASLRDDEREVITVGEEIALAERYLALQQMRFGSRLSYDIAVEPQASRCTVPMMLLQPVIENAVTHGLEAGQPQLHVTIRAQLAGGNVELCVENDGPALDASPRTQGNGVGLSATRARLITAYGDRASLKLLSRAQGGVVVKVEVPRSELLVEETV